MCLIAPAILVSLALAASPKRTANYQQESKPAPEHVIYSQLFHHVVATKKLADEEEKKGKDVKYLRSLFQEEADLSEYQARILDNVASDCVKEADKVDAKAQAIIDAYRAKYLKGKIPKGQILSPPPSELKDMQEERNKIILKYRDRLFVELGGDGAYKFKQFVEKKVTSSIRSAPSSRNPASIKKNENKQ